MPWTAAYFPVSMRHLSAPARDKAIEIANALLADGMEEGKAIRIAIAQAKRWAQDRGLPVRDDEKRGLALWKRDASFFQRFEHRARDRPAGAVPGMGKMPLHTLLERGPLGHLVVLVPGLVHAPPAQHATSITTPPCATTAVRYTRATPTHRRQ